MDDKVELDEELTRVQLKLLRKKGITEEGVAAYNRLTTGGDVARPATDPEQRDEEKKMGKDELGEVLTEKFACERRSIADDMEKIQKEILTQRVSDRAHVDTKFAELETGQGDALRVSQGISQKLDTLVAEREKASETTGSGETNILGKIEALLRGVDANAKALSRIESEVASFGAKIKNMEHRINVNTATLCKTVPGFMEGTVPLANDMSVAPEVAVTQQTTNHTGGTSNGKKKGKGAPSVTTTATAMTTTKKGAKCMATKKENGEPCDKRVKDDGFLTCGYHRNQEEQLQLRKTTLLQHVGSTASFQDTATNAQAPPTAQPSVAQRTRKSSRLKPSGVATTKKRKRGDDEEEFEHTDHSPDEYVPDCPACLQGATLTQATTSTLGTVFDEGTAFDSQPPSPEHQVPHGLTPQNDVPIPQNLPSPTSEEASRLDQYIRNDVQAELMEYSQQQSQHKSAGTRIKPPTKPGTGPERFFREAPRRGNAGSNW